MRNIFFKITNKELETYKLNKLENFQDVNEKEIISGNKCPSFYNKLGDICCPTKIIDNNCVPDKDSNKTKSGGLPICALTYDAASDWMKKNGKIIGKLGEKLTHDESIKNDIEIIKTAWSSLLEIKDHVCIFIEEKKEWTKKDFIELLTEE